MHRTVALTAVVLVVVALVGCGSGGIPENAALKVTGLVETQIGWTEEQVRAMDTLEVEASNKQGETKSYTGVLVNHLLSEAGPENGATALVFVADDGLTADVTLAEVQACEDCIVSFRNKGGFSMVLPGFPDNAQVKGIVEIQVK